jgi:hypothetical protein
MPSRPTSRQRSASTRDRSTTTTGEADAKAVDARAAARNAVASIAKECGDEKECGLERLLQGQTGRRDG